MREILKALEEFHTAFGHPVADKPSIPALQTCNLRFRLMEEENREYLDACYEGNLVEVADALGDKLYILAGTMLVHGMQDKIIEVFNEIQRSNMSKLGEDGKPIFREDGKILKGPNYSPPNIKPILDENKV